MVCLVIFSLFLCLQDVKSWCPDLKINNIANNLKSSGLVNLRLHKYKELDNRIQSPFFISHGETKNIDMIFTKNIQLVSSCKYRKQNAISDESPVGEIIYKTVYLNYTNLSQIMRVDYKLDLLASETKYSMEEIYLIDYLSGPNAPHNFISFYGCKIVNIDGKLTKFEGVFIFSSIPYQPDDIGQDEFLLNKTYSFLQKTANISKESLNTYTSINTYDKTDSCDDIIKRQNKNDGAASNLSIKQQNVLKMSISVLLLIILIVFILKNIFEYSMKLYESLKK